jgi:alcohol-forming fatty acyl-CoA reductase
MTNLLFQISAWILETSFESMNKFPIKKAIWKPHLTVTKSKIFYKLLYFFYHYVPAFFVDIILHFKGSKISVMKIYSKVYFYMGLYAYFIEHTWNFSNENMQKVHLKMTKKDHQEFPCTVTTEDYAPYVGDILDGIRKYFFKETDSDLAGARRKYKILKVLFYVLWGVIYLCLAYYLFPYIVSFRNVANDYFKTLVLSKF